MSSPNGGGAVHWLVRIAERAGLSDRERPEISAGSSASEVWTEVTKAYEVSDADLARMVAEYFRLEVADLTEADPNAALLIPETMARKHRVFPIAEDDRYFVVATSDPTNVEAERALGFSTGRTPRFVVAAPGAIQDGIETVGDAFDPNVTRPPPSAGAGAADEQRIPG